MVGWHHRLRGHEFEHALGDSEEQGQSIGWQRIRHNLATEQQRAIHELENWDSGWLNTLGLEVGALMSKGRTRWMFQLKKGTEEASSVLFVSLSGPSVDWVMPAQFQPIFTQSTDSNANPFQKHPQRYTQK